MSNQSVCAKLLNNAGPLFPLSLFGQSGMGLLETIGIQAPNVGTVIDPESVELLCTALALEPPHGISVIDIEEIDGQDVEHIEIRGVDPLPEEGDAYPNHLGIAPLNFAEVPSGQPEPANDGHLVWTETEVVVNENPGLFDFWVELVGVAKQGSPVGSNA